jgi:hypothetical protein
MTPYAAGREWEVHRPAKPAVEPVLIEVEVL